MSFLIPLIYFLLSNGLLVLLLKKSFGKCIPLTMMINAFTYLISQIVFQTFKVGFYLNIFYALLFVVLLILNRKNSALLKELKHNFFSKGFYTFLLMYIIVFIYDFNRSFSVWDEWSHWGEMVKEMLRLDQLYSTESSTLLVHKDYPPIIQLFELFYCNLIGGYKETYLIQSLHLFNLTLFIPALCESSKKFNKLNIVFKSLLAIGIIALSILLFDQHEIINTIYIDYTMAILTANLLAHILLEKKNDLFSILYLSIGCSFLVLTKQIGITLYLMILFFYFFNTIFRKKDNKIDFPLKKWIIIGIALIIIPLALWKGWGYYVHSLNLEQQFKLSDLRIKELPGIMAGKVGEVYQKQAATNYIQAIRTRSMTTSSNLALSYFQCIILVMILLYLIWYYKRKYFSNKQLPLLAITLLIGFYGYAFVMLIMYVFSFGSKEGPELASFNRYLPTYILVCISLIIMIFIYIETHDEYENKFKTIILICVALFLVQDPKSPSKLVPKITRNPENIYQHHANIISSKTEETAKVFILAQTTVGDYQFYVKYYMNPRTTNLKYFSLPTKEVDNYQKYFNEEVKDYMLEYDYLYLLMIDDNFKQKYGFLFNNQEIQQEELFSIKNDNGKVKLEKIK